MLLRSGALVFDFPYPLYPELVATSHRFLLFIRHVSIPTATMVEKQPDNQDPAPQHLPIFRLVLDQARVTDEVLHFPYEGSGTTEDPFVVTYIPQDVGNPFN